MSGFLILHWPRNTDPATISDICTRSCDALRRSHPFSSSLRLTTLDARGFFTVKLDTADSAATKVFTNAEDASWIYVLGTATYEGTKVTDSGLGHLLEEIRRNPSVASRHLDGTFVTVAFDSARERLVIIPSALGQYAVYKRRTDRGIVGVSSSILTLAALDRVSLDEFGCRSLYRCGHRLPPNTVFEEIQSIQEGSLVEVGGAHLNVQRYWIPPFGQRAGKLRAAANEIAQHLSNYCVSLIGHNQAVFSDLTGGLDSRVTTACLLNTGIPVIPTVAGSSSNPDVVLASHICQKEHLPLQVVDPGNYFGDVSSTMGAALLLAEGCIDTFTCALTTLIKRQLFEAAGHAPSVSVSGALGECYRDFFWAQEFIDRGKRQRASVDKLIRYRFDAAPKKMDFFAHDWHQEWRTRLHVYLDQIIDSYEGESNTSQIDAVYLRKMCGAIGGFSSAFGKWSVPLLPFTSRAAMDIAVAVPTQWRYNSRLLRYVAWLLHPRIADYVTLAGHPCAPVGLTNWYKFLPKYVAQTKRLVRKTSTVFLNKTLFPEYTEPEPVQNPCAALIDKEIKPGGCFDWNSMHTGQWYAPHALAALLQEARLPGGFRYRGAVSWIYTCEAMARTANQLLYDANHVHSAAWFWTPERSPSPSLR